MRKQTSPHRLSFICKTNFLFRISKHRRKWTTSLSVCAANSNLVRFHYSKSPLINAETWLLQISVVGIWWWKMWQNDGDSGKYMECKWDLWEWIFFSDPVMILGYDPFSQLWLLAVFALSAVQFCNGYPVADPQFVEDLVDDSPTYSYSVLDFGTSNETQLQQITVIWDPESNHRFIQTFVRLPENVTTTSTTTSTTTTTTPAPTTPRTVKIVPLSRDDGRSGWISVPILQSLRTGSQKNLLNSFTPTIDPFSFIQPGSSTLRTLNYVQSPVAGFISATDLPPLRPMNRYVFFLF